MKLIQKEKHGSCTIKDYTVNYCLEIAVTYFNTGRMHIALYNSGHYLCEWSKETKITLVELKKEVLHEASFYLEV